MGLPFRAGFVAVLLLGAATAVLAEADFYAGLDAFRRGNYAAAMEIWLPLAEAGDAEAQYRVARLHAEGLGTAIDDEAAVAWYGRSAAQGHARAQGALGFMFHSGRGVERDVAAAIEWYGKAALQGRAAAQRNLGEIYLEGDGVDADLPEALRWLQSAAEQDNHGAMALLGTLYEQGRGVEADPVKAFKLYKKAAGAFDADAEYHLGRAYLEGIGTGVDVRKAVRFLSRAASQGQADALAALERLDDVEAPGVEPEPAATVAHQQPEAVAASEPTRPDEVTPQQAFEKGRALMLGDGVPRDLQRAATWLRSAAEAGHPEAAYRLAMLYYRGQAGDERSYVEAWKWFDRAAAAGVGDAAEWRMKVDAKLTPNERAEIDGTKEP